MRPPVDLRAPEGEIVPTGLPGPLPQGERLLWQGRPCAFGIAVRVFHARLVALWFAALIVWAAVPAAAEGGMLGAWRASWQTLAVGFGALALVGLLAWLSARTTTYSITNRRLVMHVGIALPVTLNLPFTTMESAGLRMFADGSGDIPVRLSAGTRIAYLHLWPHARPWHVSAPQPMLRALARPAEVAGILADAFAASRAAEEGAPPVVIGRLPADTPLNSARPGRLSAVGA